MQETIHIVCTHCNATNRVPLNREHKEVNCGRCHQALFGKAPASLDAKGFATQLAKSGMPVVVDFWAPWCGPCKSMASAFHQVSLRMENKARFIKLDTEAEPALGAQFGIRSIPTLAVFKAGRELARISGALPAPELERWINSVLN